MYCTIFFTRRNFRKKNLLNCMFPSFEETPRNGERHSLQARCPTPAGRRKKHFKPHISQYFPNISKYFSNISQYFSNISPIFPNMSPIFPVFPNTSKYPPSSSRPEWSRLVSQPEARSFSERCQRRSTIQISFFRFFKISFSFPTFAGAN